MLSPQLNHFPSLLIATLPFTYSEAAVPSPQPAVPLASLQPGWVSLFAPSTQAPCSPVAAEALSLVTL